jgi:hypothetical protein
MRIWIAVLAAGLLGVGCSKEPSSATRKLEEQAKEEARKKQEQQEAEARQKKALDDLIPRLMEARRPVDEAFARVWVGLPESKTLSRKPCPDKQILADTPDEAGRTALVFNKESVFLLSGKADAREGKLETYHTPALEHGLTLRAPGAKETPLLERVAGDTVEKVQAQIDAAEHVKKYRYIGVGVITAYQAADPRGVPRAKPARVEGWLVVSDSKTGQALCQIEATGEGLIHDGTVNTDSAGDEEAWAMFVRTAGKNIDAISKALAVEGGPKKRR